MARSEQRKAEIRENYKRLREAGFSVLDAQRLRTASRETIEKAIVTGQREPLQEKYQLAAKGQKYKKETIIPYEVHKGRIKNQDYKHVEPGETKIYRDYYAYLIYYEVTDKKGNNEPRYYTITSPVKRTKASLFAEVAEEVGDTISPDYGKRLIKSSIRLLQAYYNDNPYR